VTKRLGKQISIGVADFRAKRRVSSQRSGLLKVASYRAPILTIEAVEPHEALSREGPKGEEVRPVSAQV